MNEDEKTKQLQALFDKVRRLPGKTGPIEIYMANTPETRALLSPEARAALEAEMAADMSAVPVKAVQALGATHLILVHGNEDGRKDAFRETWEHGFFDGNIPVFFSDPGPKPFLGPDDRRHWVFDPKTHPLIGLDWFTGCTPIVGRFPKRGRYTKRAQNERKWKAWHPFWGIWDFIDDGSLTRDMYMLTREDT